MSNRWFADENGEEFQYLIEANSTSEWMWSIYNVYAEMSIAGLTVTSIFSALYCYWTRNDLNADHFYHATKFLYAIEAQRQLCYKFDDDFISVCLGINRHPPDSSLNCVLPWQLAMSTSWSMERLCCSSFRCASIIRHFIKCCNIWPMKRSCAMKR